MFFLAQDEREGRSMERSYILAGLLCGSALIYCDDFLKPLVDLILCVVPVVTCEVTSVQGRSHHFRSEGRQIVQELDDFLI